MEQMNRTECYGDPNSKDNVYVDEINKELSASLDDSLPSHQGTMVRNFHENTRCTQSSINDDLFGNSTLQCTAMDILNEQPRSYNEEWEGGSPKRKVPKVGTQGVTQVDDLNIEGSNVIANSVSANDDQENEETVIIIEQVREDSNSQGEQIKSFLNNDAKYSKALKNSVFKLLGIKTVGKNIAKNILIITTGKLSEVSLKKVLSMEELGEWKVKCRLPRTEVVSIGTIGPISPDVSDEEMTEELKESYDNVIQAKRIKKRNGDNTMVARIEFMGPLPDYVKYAYRHYKVDQYINDVWQCFNCQGYGHTARECKANTKCVICSGRHTSKECQKKKEANFTARCCNCGGNHTASYGGCPKYKVAKRAEQIRAGQNLSYRDALTAAQGQASADSVVSKTPQPRMVSGQSAPQLSSPHKITKDASTQTEMTDEPQQSLPREDMLIAKVVNLVVSLFKEFDKDKPLNSEEVCKIVNNTTGVNLKDNKGAKNKANEKKTLNPPGQNREANKAGTGKGGATGGKRTEVPGSGEVGGGAAGSSNGDEGGGEGGQQGAQRKGENQQWTVVSNTKLPKRKR